MNPQIFKEAARKVAEMERHACCPAIGGQFENEAEKIMFEILFKPASCGSFYWNDLGSQFFSQFDSVRDERNRSCRVLALLFCYEIAKDEIKTK